jgi:hypothetical protein
LLGVLVELVIIYLKVVIHDMLLLFDIPD